MTLHCQLVLVLSRYAPLACDIFGRVAHVDFIKRISQSADEGVNGSGIVQLGSPSQCIQPVGRSAHRLGAPSDGSIGIAMDDRICRRNNRLKAAAAHAVQRQSWSVNLETAAQGSYAGEIHVL